MTDARTVQVLGDEPSHSAIRAARLVTPNFIAQHIDDETPNAQYPYNPSTVVAASGFNQDDPSGVDYYLDTYLYEYTLPLDPSKTVVSVTLPVSTGTNNNPGAVDIFALTQVP